MSGENIVSNTRRGDGRKLPPPVLEAGLVAVIRRKYFSSPANTLVTLCLLAAMLFVLPAIIDWAFISAVWHTQDSADCRSIAGACWAVVAEKHRVMLFGTYPYEEQYRGALVVMMVTGLAIYTAIPKFWNKLLVPIWMVVGIAVLVLMFGGVFGLPFVATNKWGGLPLTMIVFLTTVGLGFPLAIVLALGRRSKLPVIRAVCIATIEIVRGLPLISVLFMMTVFLPLFLPGDLEIDKLLRALVGMVVFFGAYAAEVVRGGLQAIPVGQFEASKALGLGYWRTTSKIILPQALRIVIPPLMNDIIRAFKNTTFVSIIGIFDILGATKASLRDVLWVRYAAEAYIFIALIFFIYCFAMSKYSEFIARRLVAGRGP